MNAAPGTRYPVARAARAARAARTPRAGRTAGVSGAVTAAVLALLCAGGAVAGPAAALPSDAMTVDGGSWRRAVPAADSAADFPTVRRGHARGTMQAV